MTVDAPAPIRLALVGLGGHGRTIQTAAEASTHIEVRAVCDVTEAERTAATKRFGCEAVAHYDDLLRRDDLDAVALVTPNHLHHFQAEAALKAGLAVFVEKPIARTVAEGRAMIETAEATGLPLMVGHNMRFTRSTEHARQLLDDGALGEIVTAHLHFSADFLPLIPPTAWRLDPASCPLLPVMQLGIHGIDLLLDLLGPAEVAGALAREAPTAPGVIDRVTALLRFESGTLGTLVCTYATQIRFSYRLDGTRGALEWTPHSLWLRRNAETDPLGEGPAERYDYTAFDRESYTRQFDAFAHAVRTGGPSIPNPQTALEALALVESINATLHDPRPTI